MKQLRPKIQDYTYTVHCDKYNKKAEFTIHVISKQSAKTDIALTHDISAYKCSVSPCGYCIDCEQLPQKL